MDAVRNAAARLELEQAEEREVERAVAMVRDQGQMLQLFVRPRLDRAQVADINHIGLQELVQRPARILVDHHRRDDPFLDVDKGVRHEALRAKLGVDEPDRRLILVQRDERNLRLHGDGVGQFPAPGLQDRQFRALRRRPSGNRVPRSRRSHRADACPNFSVETTLPSSGNKGNNARDRASGFRKLDMPGAWQTCNVCSVPSPIA